MVVASVTDVRVQVNKSKGKKTFNNFYVTFIKLFHIKIRLLQNQQTSFTQTHLCLFDFSH